MILHKDDYFINLLKKEVVPALGCTEPIAVALASAKSAETLGVIPDRIEVIVSPNILKNGMGVGIPGTGMVGLNIASALGALGGKSSKSLEVLSSITYENIEDAKNFVKENKVIVKSQETTSKLYVKVSCFSGLNVCTTIIENSHTNISSVTLNNKEIFNNNSTCNTKNNISKNYDKNTEDHTTIDEIYNFAINVPLEKITFILEGAKMNKAVALEGLSKEYGLQVGKTLNLQILNNIISNDMQNHSIALTAAACDARMAGCMMPVMSNSGSGNQGITVMMPVIATCEFLNCSEEKLARALIIANLVAIHIKSYLGKLSALCGCVVASSGASAGIVYLMDGTLDNIKYSIKNMAGNIVGMICDGAKTGCALKVATGVSAAMQSAFLAMNNIEISSNDGIIDKDVEKTIQNLAKIGNEGMNKTDELILNIMTCK